MSNLIAFSTRQFSTYWIASNLKKKITLLLPIFVAYIFFFFYVRRRAYGSTVYKMVLHTLRDNFIKYIIVACERLCASSFSRTHKRACNYSNNITKQQRQQGIHIFIEITFYLYARTAQRTLYTAILQRTHDARMHVFVCISFAARF